MGKFTARYDFSPQFALRGTVSNGFRAPTLAEESYSATIVDVNEATVQLPPNSAGAKLLGLGQGLQPEKSVNLSVGLVWRPTDAIAATLDLYQIQVTNRIVGSGFLIGSVQGMVISPVVIEAIEANGNALNPGVIANGVTGINLFANGIDTSTRGADMTFAFPVDYGAFGKVKWTIGATLIETIVTRVPSSPEQLGGQALYDQTALSDLTKAEPKYIVNLGALWSRGNLSVNLLEKVYGASSEYDNDGGDNGPPGPFTVCSYGVCNGSPSYYNTRIGVTPLTNLDLSYRFKEHITLSVGAENLFDRFPPKVNSTELAHEDNFAYQDNAGVYQYPGFSPFGINGGFYYVKASVTF